MMGGGTRRKAAQKSARTAAAIEAKGKIHPTKRPKVELRDSGGRFRSASRFSATEAAMPASCAICGAGIANRQSRREKLHRFITFADNEPMGKSLYSNTYGSLPCFRVLRSVALRKSNCSAASLDYEHRNTANLI